MNRTDEVLIEYQKFVRNFGLANFHGPDVTRGLTELNAKPKFPHRSVLLLGGNTEAYKSWAGVLGPLGFMTHLARQYHLTAGDFAPYDLVILARYGALPFNPVDMLGLRGYVATGGALAIVVSPAYDASAPGIHHTLLSLFDVQPGTDARDPVLAKKIDGNHPITRGIPAASVRHSVELKCPPPASLIEAEGKSLFAAIPYRHGRVVVSTFSQWLLPDPSVFGDQWQRHLSRYYGSSRPVSTIPVEQFSGTHAALLKQTIGWLTGPRPDAVRRQRQSFGRAWQAARQYEGRAIPRSKMTTAMQRLIDESTNEWKEEALWLAGEAHLRGYYFPNKSLLNWPTYGFHVEDRYQPHPQFFTRLVNQFPNSPLRPMAQWRIAECQRKAVMHWWSTSNHSISKDAADKLLTLYQSVEAKHGSPAWVWIQWRIGRTHYFAGDNEKAIAVLRETNEALPTGTEKVMALLDLAHVLRAANRGRESIQATNAVMAIPNYEWWDRAGERFCPLARRNGNSKFMASKLLRD